MQALLVQRGSEYEASLSEWRSVEAQLQTSVSEMTKDKEDLTERVNTLEQELNKSQSQLLKTEAQFAESKKTVNVTVMLLCNIV